MKITNFNKEPYYPNISENNRETTRIENTTSHIFEESNPLQEHEIKPKLIHSYSYSELIQLKKTQTKKEEIIIDPSFLKEFAQEVDSILTPIDLDDELSEPFIPLDISAEDLLFNTIDAIENEIEQNDIDQQNITDDHPLHSLHTSLSRNFTESEIHCLAKILMKHPEIRENISNWAKEYHENPTHEKKDLVKKEIQKIINNNSSMKDILKIAFFSKIENFKKNTKPGVLNKTAYVTKESAKSVGKIAFSPLIAIYSIGKTFYSKKKRQSIAKALKTGKLSYNSRRKLAGFLIKAGISALVATVIASEILSLGASTPLLIAFGATAGGGILTTTANDFIKGKHPVVTSGQIVGRGVEGAVNGVIGGCAAAGYAALGTHITQQQDPLENHHSEFIDNAVHSPREEILHKGLFVNKTMHSNEAMSSIFKGISKQHVPLNPLQNS